MHCLEHRTPLAVISKLGQFCSLSCMNECLTVGTYEWIDLLSRHAALKKYMY